MNSEFDWVSAAQAGYLASPPMRAIAVYVDILGDVVIRQRGVDGSPDVEIFVHPLFARTLATAIREAAKP